MHTILFITKFIKIYDITCITVIFIIFAHQNMQIMDFSNIRVSDVKIEIGSLIKKMRANRKLTQEELAKRLNLSRITIQNIERGNNFTIDTYLLIFQYFDEIQSFSEYIKSKTDDYIEIKSIY